MFKTLVMQNPDSSSAWNKIMLSWVSHQDGYTTLFKEWWMTDSSGNLTAPKTNVSDQDLCGINIAKINHYPDGWAADLWMEKANGRRFAKSITCKTIKSFDDFIKHVSGICNITTP